MSNPKGILAFAEEGYFLDRANDYDWYVQHTLFRARSVASSKASFDIGSENTSTCGTLLPSPWTTTNHLHRLADRLA